MANEKIEVEYIATQQQVLKAFEKLNKRLDETEKKLEKTGTTSKKSAKLAEGSFAALEKELKDNESALKRMAMGTKEFEKQRAKVDRLRSSLKGAKGELGGVNQQTAGLRSAAAGGVTSVAKMAAGMMGLHQTVSMVVAELEKADRLKIAAAQTNRSLEQVIADIAPNIGAANIGKARDMIRAGAVETGTTQEGYGNLIANAISAGAKDLEEAGKVAGAALRLSAGDAEAANAYAGAALDITSLAGSDNFEGALGQMSQVLSEVRADDPAQFAQAIGGALAAATAERQNVDAMTTEQALEHAAVFSQAAKDQTGSVTATGLRQYVSDVDKFIPQERATLKDGSEATVSKALISQFTSTRSLEEREQMMRQNEGLRNQFIDTLRESETKIGKVELVSGSERAMGWLAKAENKITGIDEAAGEYEGLASGVDAATSGLRASNRGAAQRQFIETEGDRGLRGQALEIFDRTVNRIDLPGLDAARIPLERRKMQGQIASGGDEFRAVFTALQSATTAKGLFEQEISAQGREELNAALAELIELQRAANQIQQQQNEKKVVVQGPQQRPKEAPLPAATLP